MFRDNKRIYIKFKKIKIIYLYIGYIYICILIDEFITRQTCDQYGLPLHFRVFAPKLRLIIITLE